MTKVWIASLVGSSIEWFDYFLYGTVAGLVFNQVFFVTDDPTVGLLLLMLLLRLHFSFGHLEESFLDILAIKSEENGRLS